MQHTLHTVHRSPSQSNVLQACLRLAADSSSVLLLEDAVYCALDVDADRIEGSGEPLRAGPATGFSQTHWLQNHWARLNWYVLENDLQARGLLDLAIRAPIQRVDYTGFVRLTEKHTRIVAWH